MILVDEKSAASLDLQKANGVTPLTVPSIVLPPPYANGSSSSVLSASTLSLPSPSPSPSPSYSLPFTQRSNNLYITRSKGSIKGSWIIDTSLNLPPSLLPAVEEGTRRKNLKLHTKQGNISARVEIKGKHAVGSEAGDQRASLLFRSDNGSIKLRLRRTEAPPLHVSCQAEAGSVAIYLPFDFQGPIRVNTRDGDVMLSPGIQRQCTPIQQSSRRCVHYIGPCPGPDHMWDRGDEVDIDAKEGKVRILFIDEHEGSKMVHVEDIVASIKAEGVVKYMGRKLQVGLDKTKEKLAEMEARSMHRIDY